MQARRYTVEMNDMEYMLFMKRNTIPYHSPKEYSVKHEQGVWKVTFIDPITEQFINIMRYVQGED